MEALGLIVKQQEFEASAPCRIDMGGTFDLSTFFLPLQHLKPCTFNAAINLRTSVKLTEFEKGKLRIRSRGFDDLVVDPADAPFDHPLGLMLAVAAYFNADGVTVDIHSASPPRSALGGSSAAAVALIWAFFKALVSTGQPLPKKSSVARLAHAIEQSVAGVPCGQQDQLAAAYGGVHVWDWIAQPDRIGYRRHEIIPPAQSGEFSKCLLVAYCGQPHASKDINGRWVRQFVKGEHRSHWRHMVGCCQQFSAAVSIGDYLAAKDAMNEETRLRRLLTPDVLDEVGKNLVAAATNNECGARFTGAGGGGCVWAFGPAEKIAGLSTDWQRITDGHEGAQLLETAIDTNGVL